MGAVDWLFHRHDDESRPWRRRMRERLARRLRNMALPVTKGVSDLSNDTHYRCASRLRAPHCTEFSKSELQLHAHRPRFEGSPRRKEIVEAGRTEIDELR